MNSRNTSSDIEQVQIIRARSLGCGWGTEYHVPSTCKLTAASGELEHTADARETGRRMGIFNLSPRFLSHKTNVASTRNRLSQRSMTLLGDSSVRLGPTSEVRGTRGPRRPESLLPCPFDGLPHLVICSPVQGRCNGPWRHATTSTDMESRPTAAFSPHACQEPRHATDMQAAVPAFSPPSHRLRRRISEPPGAGPSCFCD